MKKTKVFIDARCLARDNPSGITHYVASILDEVNKSYDELDADQSVTYHLIVPFRHRWKLGRYQLRNFKVRYMPLPFRAYNLLIRKRLLPPLDLLFGKGVYVFPEIARMPLLFSKSISIVYDAVHEAMPESMDKKMLSYVKENVESSVRKSNAIITISQFSLQQIAKPYAAYRAKFSVVSPSVNKDLFYPRSRSEIETVLARYEIFGPYILSVGNFEPRKNYETLFQAYSMLPEAVRDTYQLVVVGAASWNSQSLFDSKLAHNKQGNRILARISAVPDSDMAALYSGAALFAYPSHYEGFGMPILESMACGTPVLCGNNSALPEASGNAAVITNENNAKTFSKDMAQVLDWSDPKRNNQIKKGFDHVDSFTTWKASAKRFDEIVRHGGTS